MGYGKKFGKGRDIYTYFGFYDAEGFKPDNIYGHQFAEKVPDEVVQKVLDYKIHGNTDQPMLSFSINFNFDNFSLLTFYDQALSPSNTFSHPGYYRQRTFSLRPKYLINFSKKETLETSLSFLLMDDDFHLIDLQNEFAPVGEEGDAGGRENQLEIKSIFRTLRLPKQNLAVGFLFGNRNFEKFKQYFFTSSFDHAPFVTNTSFQEMSFFVEDIFTLKKNIILSLGLRYDYVFMDQIENMDVEDQERITPRAALSYSFDKVILKASYQQGFRYPDIGYYPRCLRVNRLMDQYSSSNERVKLKPEFSDNFEINIEHHFKEDFSFNINGFHNSYYQTLTYLFYQPNDSYLGLTEDELNTIDSIMTFQTGSINNLKKDFQTYGMEIVLNGQISSFLRLNLSYSNVFYKDIQNSSIRYPNHIVKFNTSFITLENKLKLYFNSIYYTKVDNENMHSVYEDDRLEINMSADYKILDQLSINFAVQNLLKQDIPPVIFELYNPAFGGLGFDERYFYIALKYRF